MATNFLTRTQLANAISSAQPMKPPTPGQGGQGTVIVNNTQFQLTFADPFFDSGQFEIAPSPIPPFSSGSFTVVPKAGLAGATGAVAFTFEPLPNTQCRLGAGFANPAIGSYKSNVAFDADYNQPNNSNPVLSSIQLFTQGTYNATSSAPSQSASAKFTGTDTNGSPTTIQITGTATPGIVSNVTVTQIIVSGGQ